MTNKQNLSSLSEKDAKKRDYILNGNLWKVVPSICFPLAVYQSFNHLFKVLDNIMASHIGAASVSAVAYMSQISQTVLAIGAGLAVGGSIRVARFYGAGEFEKVKTAINTLFAITFIIGIAVLAMIPFTDLILHFFGTPQVLIDEGRKYFIVILIEVVVIFFNNVYISIERSRGNTKRILYLNFVSIGIKLFLTALFVYVLNYGVTMIAVAGVIANLFISVAGFFYLRNKNDIFGLSRHSVQLRSYELAPLFKLGFPVVLEKMSFSIGKVIVNALTVVYGAITAGALGISNNIGGTVTTVQNAFQDGGSSIISQNSGAKQDLRALKTFKVVLVYNFIIGLVLCSITLFFAGDIARLFSPDNEEFAFLIKTIYSYEGYGTIALAVNASVLSLLYGFGYTKLTMIINMFRLFVFRVPVVFVLQRFFSFGYITIGYAMLISNVAVSIFSLFIGIASYKKIKKAIIK